MKTHRPLWNYVLIERQKPESRIILPDTAGTEHYEFIVKAMGPDVNKDGEVLAVGDKIETRPNAPLVMFVDEERKDLALLRASDIACVVMEVPDEAA